MIVPHSNGDMRAVERLIGDGDFFDPNNEGKHASLSSSTVSMTVMMVSILTSAISAVPALSIHILLTFHLPSPCLPYLTTPYLHPFSGVLYDKMEAEIEITRKAHMDVTELKASLGGLTDDVEASKLVMEQRQGEYDQAYNFCEGVYSDNQKLQHVSSSHVMVSLLSYYAL